MNFLSNFTEGIGSDCFIVDTRIKMLANITNDTDVLSPLAEEKSTGALVAEELIMFFRLSFYLITPNESTFEHIKDVPNYLIQGTPMLPMTMIPEYLVLHYQKKKVPSFAETITSIVCIILIFTPSIILGQFEVHLYTWIYDRYNIIDLSWNSPVTWFMCLIAVDFGTFMWHKTAHEVNFIWAFHQVHHSSQDFGLHVAQRVPTFNRYVAMLFLLPLALVFPPSVFYVHYQLNYIFQVWIHSLTFPSLGPLDYIINNPSVHRVHHGRNRYCIDKNYANVFTFWDVLFGTFERERPDEEIFYGLVSNVRSFDVVYLQIHHFRDIVRRWREMSGIKNKLSVIFKGPGWAPGQSRLGDVNDIPEIPEDRTRYDTKPSLFLKFYLFVHVCVTLFTYIKISKNREMLPISMITSYVAFIAMSGVCYGYILEKKRFIPAVEGLRCGFYLVLDVLYQSLFPAGTAVLYVLRAIHLASALYWSFNLTMFFSSKEKIKNN